MTLPKTSSEAEFGIISSLTLVFFGPLISRTTSSILQSLTSSNSFSGEEATPTILSFTFKRPDLSAGPPGTNLTIFVIPSSTDKMAPIPSRERLIFISKSSCDFGER